MNSKWDRLSKQDWLELVKKELKDKPYDSITKRINDRIIAEPYYTYAETDHTTEPLITRNDWQIAELFMCRKGNEALINSNLLEALNGGLESPTIEFSAFPDVGSLKQIFQGVELSFISIYFRCSFLNTSEETEEFLRLVCETGDIEASQLRGGIITNSSNPFLSEQFPNFKTLSAGHEPDSYHADPDEYLASLLTKAHNLINHFPAGKQDKAYEKIVFNIEIGRDYLTEIAKLRALYLLWGNLQLSQGIKEAVLPFINVEFTENAYEDDLNKNMIVASTLAMSAVIGGGSRITIRPGGPEESAFQRRISRNVLHLLELESGFKLVPDPAAGSYYIEQLTGMIADSAWKIFLRK